MQSTLCGYCISPSMVFVVRGTTRGFVAYRAHSTFPTCLSGPRSQQYNTCFSPGVTSLPTFMARSTARTSSSSSSSNPQAVPLSIPGAKPPGWPLRLPRQRLELVGTRPPQKRWLREPNLLRLLRLRRRMTTTCTFAYRGRRWRQWTGQTEPVQHHVSQSAGPQNAAPVLQSVPVQLPAPTS